MDKRSLNGFRHGHTTIEPQHKCLNRSGNVLQTERPKLLKSEVEPVMHMVAHGSRDADSACWAFGLKSCRHVHGVAVEISPICNRVTDVNSHPKADGLICGMVAVVSRHLLLHLDGTAYRPVDAVEHDQQ